MCNLVKRISQSSRVLTEEITGVTEGQLNTLFDKASEEYMLDPSHDFREKVINAGYRITGLFKVFWHLSEQDGWSCTARREDNKVNLYSIETTNGSLTVTEV